MLVSDEQSDCGTNSSSLEKTHWSFIASCEDLKSSRHVDEFCGTDDVVENGLKVGLEENAYGIRATAVMGLNNGFFLVIFFTHGIRMVRDRIRGSVLDLHSPDSAIPGQGKMI